MTCHRSSGNHDRNSGEPTHSTALLSNLLGTVIAAKSIHVVAPCCSEWRNTAGWALQVRWSMTEPVGQDVHFVGLIDAARPKIRSSGSGTARLSLLGCQQ